MKLSKIFIIAAAAAAFLAGGCGEKTPDEIAQLNRKKSELAVRRAQVMIAENRADDAVKMLESAYSECGANPKVCEALANALAQRGQTAAAGVFFEQAFDGDNSRPEFLIFAANAYEQTNSLEAAVTAYEKYLKAVPGDASAMKSLAKLLDKCGIFDRSLNMYMASLKASKRDPDTAEASVIGGLFAKLGNFAQAKLWLETALSVTLPENVSTRKDIYTNLIGVYLARKEMPNLENAISELDKIDPKIVNEKFPTLKANLAEFKHKLAEAEAIAAADTRRRALEAEQEAEKAAEQKAAEQKAAEQKAAEQKASEQKAAEQKDASAPADQPKQAASDAPAQSAESAPAQPSESAADAPQTQPAAEKPAAEKLLNDAPPVEEIASSAADAPRSPEPSAKPEESDLDRYVRLANEAIAKKQKRQALDYANGAIANGALSPEAWFVMAGAFELNGAHEDAYLAANEAYLIDPSNAGNAVKFLRFASSVKKSETFLNAAVSILRKFPAEAGAVYYAALAHENSGDAETAKKLYKKYLELDSSDGERAQRAESFLKK